MNFISKRLHNGLFPKKEIVTKGRLKHYDKPKPYVQKFITHNMNASS